MSFISVESQISSFNPPIDNDTVAAKLNKSIFGFGENVPAPSEFESSYTFSPVSKNTPEGSRIYKRSIVFLLGAAVQKCKLGPLSVMETIGSSFHFNLPNESINDSIATKLNEAMNSIISEKLAIIKCSIPRAEAIKYFANNNSQHTLDLINSISSTHIDCNSCNLGDSGRYLTLAHGVLIGNTATIQSNHFSINVITTPFTHFRLNHAISNHTTGDFSLIPTDEPLLSNAYSIRKSWCNKIQLDTVTNINNQLSNARVKSVVQLSEALHDQQVVTIAGSIAGSPGMPPSGPTPRLVLIAGPSSSGKTTFAKRLCVSLETLGAKPIVLSVDSYYKGWPDIDSRGMSYVDWESLKSLNLELLNEHLLDLLDGKEILMPEYDMRTSMPMAKEHWTKLQLPSGGLIIMEGIHCLNPELTPRVKKSDKFQIMISPLSALILDDLNLISSSQVRMLRRMVRDHLFRGRSAQGTLKQWPAIAQGERTNIYPNQNNADVVMNSGLTYEAHVLKVYAEPLLRGITPDMDEYSEARRLLSMLDNLVSIPAELVPPQSLLREFIGGSWFYEYGGLYKTA
jgi:uridine kinase